MKNDHPVAALAQLDQTIEEIGAELEKLVVAMRITSAKIGRERAIAGLATMFLASDRHPYPREFIAAVAAVAVARLAD